MKNEPESEKLKVGILLFPNLTQLDLTAPYEVFSRMPETEVYLLAKDKLPVISEKGLTILPTLSFAESPVLDIIFVPGGPGIGAAIEDIVLMDFLKTRGEQARFVTSVCTGSLLLAAAGLLEGYKATTHWLSLDLLRMFGVEVLKQRVVIDRNRITGGGVTAGLDFALTMAAEIFGEQIAKAIQLMIEYNPQPPFDCGSPQKADKEIVETMKEKSREIQQKRKELIVDFLRKAKHTN